MLEFAEQLTAAPNKLTRSEVEKLKSVGFKDADILDIVLVTAYYAFVNRMAMGLGVELEKYLTEG